MKLTALEWKHLIVRAAGLFQQDANDSEEIQPTGTVTAQI